MPGELVLLDPAHGVKPHASKYWEFYTGASRARETIRAEPSGRAAQDFRGCLFFVRDDVSLWFQGKAKGVCGVFVSPFWSEMTFLCG